MNDFKIKDKIYSSQVYYTGKTLSGTSCDLDEICQGKSLDEIIEEFYNGICTIEDTCKVKINADDKSCDYLTNKITSTDGSITKNIVTDGDGNKTLDLSTSANNIVTNNTFINSTITRTTIGNFESITFPSNIFSTNGDIIELETSFHLNAEIWSGIMNMSVLQIQAGSLSLLSGVGFLNTWYIINVRIEVSRVSDTTVKYTSKYDVFDSTGVSILSGYVTSSGTLSTSDGFTITTKLTSIDSGNASVSNTGMIVKYFKKS